MNNPAPSISTLRELTGCPVNLVCPVCQNEKVSTLASTTDTQLICSSCDTNFSLENGFANLVVGERFEDTSDEECLCYEEDSNEYTTKNFWIPLFKSILKNNKDAKLLAVGCGIGREVDMLCDAGLECIGIDNGNRAKIWPNRKYGNHLIMANGMQLPFTENTFDIVFCGCVFPHVGVNGDSTEVTDSYLQDRTKLATEMRRVLKPGGKIIVASPNRFFPFDIFHGRPKGSYLPKLNRFGERFLLSYHDYKKMFYATDMNSSELLPVSGYWGFVRSKNSLKGLILGLPIRIIFNLLSIRPFAFLRSSFIAPWLVVMLNKNHESKAQSG